MNVLTKLKTDNVLYCENTGKGNLNKVHMIDFIDHSYPPVTKMYKITPRLHMSDCRPSYSKILFT